MTTPNYFNRVESLFNNIERGMQGLNIGLSTGIPKLDRIISGWQRQTFYLIGGGTGSGKSTFALYSGIYRPLMFENKLGDEKFKVIYFSLEMSAEVLFAKLLSMYIFDTYSLELTYEQILSRQEILSEDYYKIVLSAKDWLEQVQKQVIIYDKTLTTKGMYAFLKEYADKNGEFIDSGDGRSTVYIPKVQDQYVLVFIDHIGLIRAVNQTKKEAADEASDFLIQFRNKCGYSPVVVMQLNRQASSMDRRTENMQEPELQDFKGSGGPGEAAEIVLALFHPSREKMTSWKKYDLRQLKDNFRAIFCLKNRFGTADQAVPVNFFGSIGLFREIPKPEEIAENYLPYLSLRYEPEEERDTGEVKEMMTFTL